MEDISIGAGILLGFLALSLVFLIVYTRDRWKWGRIFGIAVAIPTIGLIALVVYEYYEESPRKLYEYAGLKLGMSREDVIFRKGFPDETMFGEEHNKTEAMLYPWNVSGTMAVGISDGRVVYIICLGGESSYKSFINWVSIGDSYEELIETLGEPTTTNVFSPVNRGFYFDKFNMQIGVFEGEVISAGIALDPEAYGWLECEPTGKM